MSDLDLIDPAEVAQTASAETQDDVMLMTSPEDHQPVYAAPVLDRLRTSD